MSLYSSYSGSYDLTEFSQGGRAVARVTLILSWPYRLVVQISDMDTTARWFLRESPARQAYDRTVEALSEIIFASFDEGKLQGLRTSQLDSREGYIARAIAREEV